jgi:probable rRNA maturation factor
MLEINNRTKYKISAKKFAVAAEKFLKSKKLAKKTVSLVFIGDAVMRNLNRRYRGLDKTTDVLSFAGDDDLLGEIVISPAQIKRQAKENSNTFEQELVFIFVHGLLHLAGYNDDTEKKRTAMIKMGEKFILNLKS